MDRAYSILTITKADAAARVVEGLCSTPTRDLAGDVVEPLGGKWALPCPFLHQHDHASPVGWVEKLEARPDGIRFRARLAQIADAGALRDRLNLVWDEIRTGLLKGVSIGFSITKAEPIATGLRILEWTLHEISAVTIPCNQEATIQTVKAADQAILRKRQPARVVRLSAPQTPLAKSSRVVRLDSSTAPVSARPVADAMSKAMEQSHAEIAAEAERRRLGVGHRMTIDVIAAGAKATDAELAAIRARLEQLERG